MDKDSENLGRTSTTNGKGREKSAADSPPVRPKRGRPPRTEIDPRQMLALGLLIQGKSRKVVARQLGVDEKTIGRWLQEPAVRLEFRQQLASLSAEMWAMSLAERAVIWAGFRELLKSQDERIRLRAITWYLDRMLSLISMGRLLQDDPHARAPLPTSLSAFLAEGSEEDGGEVAGAST